MTNKPDNRRCACEGERCLGCDHYHGKAPICAYATPDYKAQRRIELAAPALLEALQRIVKADDDRELDDADINNARTAIRLATEVTQS